MGKTQLSAAFSRLQNTTLSKLSFINKTRHGEKKKKTWPTYVKNTHGIETN